MVQFAAQLAISAALTYAANRLLAKKDKSLRDDRPTPLAQRGTMMPYLAGQRRFSPHFLWAGRRTTRNEQIAGSKGKSSSGSVKVYVEDAFLGILGCPGTRLHNIGQNGKKIFRGPIDSLGFPSGSFVDLGIEGSFAVGWGDVAAPINTDLGLPDAVTIASRWPLATTIQWKRKRLGPSPNWSLVDFEMERRPSSQLANSQPWIEPTRTLGSGPYTIVTAINGTAGTAAFVINGDHTDEFRNGGFLLLDGNAAPDGDYAVLGATYVGNIRNPDGTYTTIDQTTVLLAVPLVGATNIGTIQPYVDDQNGGANPAHVIWEKLFAKYPIGRSLKPELFNLASLEDLGQLAEEERIPVSVASEDGDDTAGILASIMQDFGVTCALEKDGLYVWRAQRYVDPVGLPLLTNDVIKPPLPQIDNAIDAPEQPTRTVFLFPDRTRGYRDFPVKIDDDGRATPGDDAGPRTRRPRLPTITDVDTAQKVAERRSQEDQPGMAAYRIHASRAARTMPPGQVFISSGLTTTGIAGNLRLLSRRPTNVISGEVELVALPDHYGAPVSAWGGTDGGGAGGGSQDPKPDKAYTFLEVPAHVLASFGLRDVQGIVVPRLRAHANIVGADLWLSRDNTTYTMVGTETAFITGGRLTAPMLATDDPIMAQGPILAIMGPDVATTLDLTADPINWRAGRMLVLIDDPVNGQELCFLQKLTSQGGGLYRMDGLIHARFDTSQVAHPAGIICYIFQAGALALIRDLLLAPAVPIWVKSQPRTDESWPLNNVTPVTRTLVGKGIVPMAPFNLRTTNCSNSYKTTQSIPFEWSYRSALALRTGAGMQGAGTPTGVSPVDGEFSVRFTTTGGVIMREVVGITQPNLIYSNAQLAADFTGEPSSFKCQVFNVKSGYSSPQVEITVVKVS